MKKILITGAAGFIGSNLNHFLKDKGFNPLTPTRDCLDLCNKSELLGFIENNKPQVIFHLASTGVAHNHAFSKTVCEKNLIMISNLLEAALPKTDIVVAGSMSEYSDEGILSEDSSTQPVTEYGKSKVEVSNYIRDYNNTKDLNIWLGRIFAAYGYGESSKRLFPYLKENLESHKECLLSDGLQIKDFIHVYDICQCLYSLSRVQNINHSPFVNIGTGEGIKLRDLVSNIAMELVGSTTLLKFGKRPRSPHDANVQVADTTKLKELIGKVPPQRLNSNSGLLRYFSKDFMRFSSSFDRLS